MTRHAASVGLAAALLLCAHCGPRDGGSGQEPAAAPKTDAAETPAPAAAADVVLVVDDALRFVTRDTVQGDWYAGPGVRCALPLEIDGERRVCGRLESADAEARFYRRGEDGRFQSVTASTAPPGTGSRDPAASFDAALAIFARTPAGDGLDALRDVLGDSPDAAPSFDLAPGPVSRVKPSGTPPAAGADLAAFVPDDLVYARFRSVAAAFRITSEIDALITQIAVRHGRSVDAGTLRLTLHHLLLPTIWNTNPESETGVSEMALVVAPPYVPGALRAAVLMRIVDPELHRMQTLAGIAQESREDHLWRPPDDPFPEERVRHPFRKQVGDVEIVSTDSSLCDLLAGGVAHSLADDADFADARSAAGEMVREEAVFLFVPEGADRPEDRLRALRRAALRRETGLRKLVARWTGAPEQPATGVLDPALFAPGAALPRSVLQELRWLRVVTNVDGAIVSADLHQMDDDFLVQDVSRSDVPAADRAAACADQRRWLAPLVLLDGAARGAGADLAERAFVVFGQRPVCPEGGRWSAHPVTRALTCSVHGPLTDARPSKDGRTAVGSVRAETHGPWLGLTFELAIDWSRRQ